MNLCPVCKAVAEDPLHMVLNCLEVEQVWREHGWFSQAISSPLIDFTDLLSRFLQVTKDNRVELFICMAWSLWQRRNKLRIGLPSPSLNLVGLQATKFLQDYLDAQEVHASRSSMETSTQSWCPSSSHPFKANFDGALFNNSNSAGIGDIICDRNGGMIATMSECIPLPNTVLEVEAMACRRAVKFAYEVGIQDVTFEGDSLTVIQALNYGSASEALYGNLIDDITVCASSLSTVEFKHVKRSCNRIADALAKKAKYGDVFQAWMEDIPPDIAPLAIFDVH